MQDIVKVKEKEIPVISNAATAFLYKQCFKEDLLTFLSTEHPDGEATEVALKVFYIMAKQAEIPEMSKLIKSDLNYENFMVFISGFDFLDTGSIALQAYNIWNKNAKRDSSEEATGESPKKKTAKAGK